MRRIQSRTLLLCFLLTVAGCMPGAKRQTADTIRVQRMEIVDRGGQVRAILDCSEDGVWLRLQDRQGRKSVSVGMKDGTPRDRPMIIFYDADERASAVLGYPTFLVEPPDMIWADKKPSLVFLSDSESVMWQVPASPPGPHNIGRFLH